MPWTIYAGLTEEDLAQYVNIELSRSKNQVEKFSVNGSIDNILKEIVTHNFFQQSLLYKLGLVDQRGR
jgi:hypothetical protein